MCTESWWFRSSSRRRCRRVRYNDGEHNEQLVCSCLPWRRDLSDWLSGLELRLALDFHHGYFFSLFFCKNKGMGFLIYFLDDTGIPSFTLGQLGSSVSLPNGPGACSFRSFACQNRHRCIYGATVPTNSNVRPEKAQGGQEAVYFWANELPHAPHSPDP